MTKESTISKYSIYKRDAELFTHQITPPLVHTPLGSRKNKLAQVQEDTIHSPAGDNNKISSFFFIYF